MLVRPDDGVLLGLKTVELSSHEKTWRIAKGTRARERSPSEKVPSCLTPAVETGSTGGVGGRGDEPAECRRLEGTETIPYSVIDMRRYVFVFV